MAEYLSPGVYVEEFETGMRAMEGVGTSTAGFLGLAERGAVQGTPEYITSFAEYTRKFGGYLSEAFYGKNRFLPYAVEQFFANGGTRCYVMRVAPEDARAASVAMSSVVITAKNPGRWGNGIRVTVSASSRAKTQVLEVMEDVVTASKSYLVKNAAGFATGDVVALIGKGEEASYNRVTRVDGNALYFEKDFEEEVIDKNLVPQRQLATCEAGYRNSLRGYGGAV